MTLRMDEDETETVVDKERTLMFHSNVKAIPGEFQHA